MPEWWKNPYKYLDAEDLLSHDASEAKASAIAFFEDLIVHRPTEFTALLSMFLRAYYNIDTTRARLTHRQQEAVHHAIDAMGLGVNPAAYVAESLSISPQAARRLLHRADDRVNVVRFGELVHYGSSNEALTWQPTRKEIRNKMASLPKRCATHGTSDCLGTSRGDYVLCWNCRAKYGTNAGEWPAWVYAEVRNLEREHRMHAVNELFKEHRRASPQTHDADYADYAEAS